jgi:hypothetical protein
MARRKDLSYERGDFGERMEQARAVLGLSYRQLAEAAGEAETFKGSLQRAGAGTGHLTEKRRRNLIDALVRTAHKRGRTLDSIDYSGLLAAAKLPEQSSPIQDGAENAPQAIRRLLDDGVRHVRKLAHHRAIAAYSGALQQARTPIERGRALVGLAVPFFEIGAHNEAWGRAAEARQEAGFTDRGLSDSGVSAGTLESQVRAFSDGTMALEIDATAMKIFASIAHDRNQEGLAQRCFERMLVIGEVMGDSRKKAAALVGLAGVELEWGSAPGGHGEWRLCTDPRHIGAAIAHLDRAWGLYPKEDVVARGHVRRMAAWAQYLLRDSRAVDKLVVESASLLGGSQARLSLDIDEAWRGMEDNPRKYIPRLLHAQRRAIDIQSPVLLAQIHHILADHYALGGKEAEAKHHLAASLLAFPTPIDSRTSLMTTILAHECGLQPEDMDRFIQGSSDEMAQLWQLPSFNLEERRAFASSRRSRVGIL